MTNAVADDAASEVFTDAAESVFEVESLYESDSIAPERDEAGEAEDGEEDADPSPSHQAVAASQAAKAIEAAAEQGRAPSPSSPEESDGDRVEVVLDDGPAPPDYAAATAGRPSPILVRDNVHSAQDHQVRTTEPRDVEGTGIEEQARESTHRDLESHGAQAVGPNTSKAKSRVEEDIIAFQLAFQLAVQTVRARVEPYTEKGIDVIDRTVWRHLKPPLKKVAAVIEPPASTVGRYVELHLKKLAIALEPAKRQIEPRIAKAASVINPVVRNAGRQVERRTRKIAVAVEPPLQRVQMHITPVTKKAATRLAAAVGLILRSLVKFCRLLISKHTFTWIRQHFLYLCLAQATFIFFVLFLVTFAKKPRYTRFEVYPEYYPKHPQRSHPYSFHERDRGCYWTGHSDFTRTRIENSGDFSFLESIDTTSMPNISLSGRIDIAPAPLAQNVPIEVWYNIATTWVFPATNPKVKKVGNTLRMQHPYLDLREHGYTYDRQHRGHYTEDIQRCADIWVGIYVNIEMENFNISTNNFHVNLADFSERSPAYAWDSTPLWELGVKRDLHISTKVGDVSSSVFMSAKNIEIRSEGGSIRGSYRFRDNLTLESGGEGNIHTTVEQLPRNVFEGPASSITPSFLRTRTDAGDTDLQLTNSYGHQEADAVELSTDSTNHNLSRSDYQARASKQYLLDAHHSSSSGVMTLKYGSAWRNEWEGFVEGLAKHPMAYICAMNQRWIYPNTTLTPAGEHLTAKIGSSDSEMRFNSTDGLVLLYINQPLLSEPL